MSRCFDDPPGKPHSDGFFRFTEMQDTKPMADRGRNEQNTLHSQSQKPYKHDRSQAARPESESDPTNKTQLLRQQAEPPDDSG